MKILDKIKKLLVFYYKNVKKYDYYTITYNKNNITYIFNKKKI